MSHVGGGLKHRVIVVDDNRDAADTLALLLQHSGYDAHPFYGGAAALESIRALRPHCIVSDINMPGMDGCELARLVRAEFAGVKLVAVTGRNDEEHLRRVRDAGFDHQFTKPADPSALLEVLALMEKINDLAEQTRSLAAETKQLLTDVKEEVRGVKAEVRELKNEVKELKQELGDYQQDDGHSAAYQ